MGIERRGKKAPRSPLEHLLLAAVLPNLGGPSTFENDDHFLIEMFFRFQSSAGRDFPEVHSSDAFHAVEVAESAITAGARPWRGGDIAHILDTETVHHR